MTTETPQPGWWVSWYHIDSLGEFELHSPWWVSGCRLVGDLDGDLREDPTMVAAVRAADAESAREFVIQSYDNPPVDLEWRFVDDLPDGPAFTDRFPKGDWMAWDSDGRTCNCPKCQP